jgi:hypothetical protein
MITRATLSTIEQGLPKYRSMLAGNSAYSPGAFESIATATGSGASTITLSAIPSTYQHLQLRILNSTTGDGYFRIRLNGLNTGYSKHYLYGNGSSVAVEKDTGLDGMYFLWAVSAGATFPPINIIDIHNYASTTQTKVVRALGGTQATNTSTSEIWIASYLLNNTSAISSITIDTQGSAGSFTANNSVALYGIKGA